MSSPSPSSSNPAIMDNNKSNINNNSDPSTGTNTPSKSKRNNNNRLINNNNTNNFVSNCIVLKNLHFKMTKETLTEVIDRVMNAHNEANFTTLTMVEDKYTGVFKGTAFVSFSSVQHATVALNEMNKVAINGRKVIAEFRRVSTPKQPQVKKPNVTTASSTVTAIAVTAATAATAATNVKEDDQHVDKRALFFANRDNEKEKKFNRFVNQVDEKRDKEREDRFRNILLDFANGKLKSNSNNSNNDNEIIQLVRFSSTKDGKNNDTNTDMDLSNQLNSVHVAQQQPSSDNIGNGVNESTMGNDMDASHDKSHVNGNSEEISKEDNVSTSLKDSDSREQNLEVNTDTTCNDIEFNAAITSYERRMIHMICDELGLGHISRFDEGGNRILYVTLDKKKTEIWALETANEKETEKENSSSLSTKSSSNTPNLTKSKSVLSNPNSATKSNSSKKDQQQEERGNSSGPKKKLHYTRPRGAIGDDGESGSGLGLLSPSYKIWTPSRQPIGPPRDGGKSKGFERRRTFHGLDPLLNEQNNEGEVTGSKQQQQSDSSVVTSKGSKGYGRERGKSKGKGKGSKDKKSSKEVTTAEKKEEAQKKEKQTHINDNVNKPAEKSIVGSIKVKSRKKRLDPNVPSFEPKNSFNGNGSI